MEPSLRKSRVYDAPMALEPDLSRTRGLDPHFAWTRNQRHLLGLRHAIVGPMPVEEFMDRLLAEVLPTTDPARLLSSRNAFKSVPADADTPAEICRPLLASLNKRTKHKSRCPGFVFRDTAGRSVHPAHLGYAKPHITCFTKDNADIVRRSSRRSRTELGYAELFIHVTSRPNDDMFTDPPAGGNDERHASHDLFDRLYDLEFREEIEEAFALQIAFATEVFARQHRIFFFSISLAGPRARLLRWDRAGCVVSQAFDIRDHPEHLCAFIWRFSQTSDEARGHDLTVRPARLGEELRFRDAIREHVRVQLGVDGEKLDEALRQHYYPGHAVVMAVYSQRFIPKPGFCEYFIVCRPVISPLSLVGRGTRGYWAVDLVSSRVVFLKDTWRVQSDGGVEGDLLAHLHNLGVRNIPSLVTHGDVPGYFAGITQPDTIWHITLTDVLTSDPWVCRVGGKPVCVIGLQNYRMVMGTVGYGLASVRGTEELLHATYDAFTAMKDALAKDSRIHRDISFGNIILVKEAGRDIRRGYLIDWEVSDRVDNAGQSTRPGRAGTWFFMSWRMLDMHHVDGRHVFMDDVESLIHVVTYCALHYLPHKLSSDELITLISDHFEDSFTSYSGVRYGGRSKLLNAYTRNLIKDAGFGSEALVEWLNGILDLQIPRNNLPSGLDVGPEWTAENVDDYWSTFLNTHTLERDNRVVHEITDKEYRAPSPSDTTASKTFSRRKRAAEGHQLASVDAPSPKRRRPLRLQQGLSHTAAVEPPPLDPPPPVGPRRSSRIKAHEAQAQGHGEDRALARRANASKARAVGRQMTKPAGRRVSGARK